MTDPVFPVQDLSGFTDREIAEAALYEVAELAARLGSPTMSMLQAGAQPQQPGTLMHGVLVLKAKADQIGNLIEALLDVLGPATKAAVLSRLSLDESSRRLEAARRGSKLHAIRGGKDEGGA